MEVIVGRSRPDELAQVRSGLTGVWRGGVSLDGVALTGVAFIGGRLEPRVLWKLMEVTLGTDCSRSISWR